MIDGIPLIDVHLHAARLPTLPPAWRDWAERFGDRETLARVYDDRGDIRPDRFDAYLDDEGVEMALLLCEYSPRVTGWQPIEDVLPIVEHNPRRFRPIAALNPHVHHPLLDELERQLALGAVALKLHPAHGGFSPTHGTLYPVYQRCAEIGLPVVFHCGTSTFPGAINRYADPALIDEVIGNVPDLKVVLAHGGRGWWYDAAAFLALNHERVWIELSGLPPRRLPDYYARYGFRRVAGKCIFGTDWPGVPGIAANARAITKLDIDADDVARILSGNALEVYRGLDLGP